MDEPGHYNYLEFNLQPAREGGGASQQRQRPADNYQGLDPAERRPPAPHLYTGIGSDQPRLPTDSRDYLVPVSQPEIELDTGVERQLQQPPESHDHDAVRSEEERATEQRRENGNRHGYEGLDPSVLEELRRPQRPHEYAGIGTGSAADAPRPHSYLELIEYAGSNDQDDCGATAVERDPPEVEEPPGRTDKPHDHAGTTDGNGRNSQGEVTTERGGYEGLNLAEVEESRRRARRPHEYAGLKDNVEDLYSRPVKRP